MSINISGWGLEARLIASVTFPVGVTLTEFADDTDPLDVPSVQIGDAAMGLNGDLITWAKATRLDVSLSVIPNSNTDVNLAILFNQNRPAKGKLSIPDSIILTLQYPSTIANGNPKFVTYTGGKILTGMPSNAVASSARMKTKTYGFAFENVVFS